MYVTTATLLYHQPRLIQIFVEVCCFSRFTTGRFICLLDENQGDSSDGLWSMYLAESEKRDKEVIESWKGDTDGILVFVSPLRSICYLSRLNPTSKTGLFSATVATFIVESLQNLSPDSSKTTNALLTQISQQLFNISNGTPLTSVVAQSGQPFTPTASAIRVNVLWFLSLILSLTCTLSATLIQQWARRYQELTQRHGATHRRGRMRAYIHDGITRFEMVRVVATMPTLLHISVFFFFAGIADFLSPFIRQSRTPPSAASWHSLWHTQF